MSRTLDDRITAMEERVLNAATVDAARRYHRLLDLLRAKRDAKLTESAPDPLRAALDTMVDEVRDATRTLSDAYSNDMPNADRWRKAVDRIHLAVAAYANRALLATDPAPLATDPTEASSGLAPDPLRGVSRWNRVHKPHDPECPYIVCKCDPTPDRLHRLRRLVMTTPDPLRAAQLERELSDHSRNMHLGHTSDFCDECQRLITALTADTAPLTTPDPLRAALERLQAWTGPSIPTDLAMLILDVERAALATDTAPSTCWDTDGDHALGCWCRQGGEIVHRLDAATDTALLGACRGKSDERHLCDIHEGGWLDGTSSNRRCTIARATKETP